MKIILVLLGILILLMFIYYPEMNNKDKNTISNSSKVSTNENNIAEKESRKIKNIIINEISENVFRKGKKVAVRKYRENNGSHKKRKIKRILEQNKKLITKTENCYIIFLKNGKQKKLCNNDCNCEKAVLYRLEDYIKELNSFVFEIFYYEGGDYYLVNTISGNTIRVGNYPILSPDGGKFIAYSSSIQDYYADDIYQIIQLRDNKFFKVKEELTQKMSPIDMFWVGNNKIYLKMQLKFSDTANKRYKFIEIILKY